MTTMVHVQQLLSLYLSKCTVTIWRHLLYSARDLDQQDYLLYPDKIESLNGVNCDVTENVTQKPLSESGTNQDSVLFVCS